MDGKTEEELGFDIAMLTEFMRRLESVRSEITGIIGLGSSIAGRYKAACMTVRASELICEAAGMLTRGSVPPREGGGGE
jgi:hypothetical protein